MVSIPVLEVQDLGTHGVGIQDDDLLLVQSVDSKYLSLQVELIYEHMVQVVNHELSLLVK